MIDGLRPGLSKTRALSLLAKYKIFDKKLIQGFNAMGRYMYIPKELLGQDPKFF